MENIKLNNNHEEGKGYYCWGHKSSGPKSSLHKKNMTFNQFFRKLT